MAAQSPDARAFLTTSHELAKWMIQLADTKASILMAASAILAGLLSQLSVTACNTPAKFVLTIAAGFALLTAGTCLLTIWPRTQPQSHGSLLYYRAIMRYKNRQDYLARVRGLTAADTDNELAHQVWELAPTQERKYHFLGIAVKIFGLCIALALVGLVLTRAPCS